jgi:hypothetical protein
VTLKGARAALAAEIVTALGDPTVTVLAYDPATVQGDTVTVGTARITPTEYQLFLRIYVPSVQSAQGQDRLDDLTEAVDAADLTGVPRGEWEFAFDESKEAFLMLSTVDWPREDF